MTFHHDQKFFDITDYIVFAITLLIPILIGMYYSFIAKNTPKTVSEYLVGNRNMGLFPVSMSLAARYCIYLLDMSLNVNYNFLFSVSFLDI